MPLIILIVGGGLAGLATALALARKGHSVSILERNLEGHKPDQSASGIQLNTNAMRILKAWGLLEQFDGLGHPSGAHATNKRYSDGRVLKVLRKKEGALWPRYIRRVDMWQILCDAAVKHGVRVLFGQRVVSLDDSKPSVTLEDGETMVADLIVGADGTNSRVRRTLFPSTTTTITPIVTFQIQTPKSTMLAFPNTAALYADPKLQYYAGPGLQIVSSVVPHHSTYDTQLVDHEYGLEPDGSANNERIIDLTYVRKRFAITSPAVRHIIETADSAFKWRLIEAPDLSTWLSPSGRIALAGDGAHGTVPFAGQGTGMCIEDAAVLSVLFPATTSPDLVPARLKLYEELRKPRLERVRAHAHATGRWGTLPDGETQLRRDQTMLQPQSKQQKMMGAMLDWIDDFDVVKEAERALRDPGRVRETAVAGPKL